MCWSSAVAMCIASFKILTIRLSQIIFKFTCIYFYEPYFIKYKFWTLDFKSRWDSARIMLLPDQKCCFKFFSEDFHCSFICIDPIFYLQSIIIIYSLHFFLCSRPLVRRFNYTFSSYDIKKNRKIHGACSTYILSQATFAIPITCLWWSNNVKFHRNYFYFNS